MDLSTLAPTLQANYGLTAALTPAPLAAEGHNNTLIGLDTPQGAYVLKLMAQAPQEAQQRELRLLEQLSRQHLPFKVAQPCRTLQGEWSVALPPPDRRHLMVLPRLPGGRVPNQPDAWRQVGETLRSLHGALAHLPAGAAPLPLDWTRPDLLHPAVLDPVALAQQRPELWGGVERARTWAEHYRVARQMMATRLAPLSRQLIHGDFNTPNLLFDHGRVTAVLDFEFASVAPPLLDVATALSEVLQDGPLPRWDLARALLDGYGPLSAAEQAALPAALLARQTAVGVWGLGQALEHGPTTTTLARLNALGQLLALIQTEAGQLRTLTDTST
ncbi:phosphotransferase [Deinococcus sonorensis]|uniref:Phosphotransferase n=2 Tax=Deinococcus sonorensis TaxID=309891 RepID=A0AAU7U4Q8_9DEIO